MNSESGNRLSREKVQQLLSAVGSRAEEDTSQVDAPEYNWLEPHYFNRMQLMKLDDFAERVASAMAAKFTDFCRNEFEVTITSISQHFADEFLQSSGGRRKEHFLPFGPDAEHMCGFVGVPEQTTLVWAKQLLGDSESEDGSDKSLSPLEESLLLDLASALIEVFFGPYPTCDFRPADNIVRGRWPLEVSSTQELCKIAFEVKKVGGTEGHGAYFLISCRELEPITGKTTQVAEDFSPNEIYRAVLHHLQEIPVTVTAHLASTSLTFEEMMNLQVGDVVLMDKKVDEAAELFVDGQRICYGWPVKSAGRYAIAIAEASLEKVN